MPMGNGVHPAYKDAPKRKAITPQLPKDHGKAPKDYLTNSAGNAYLEEASGAKSADSISESGDSYIRRTAENTRKMQLKDQSEKDRDFANGK